MHVIKFSLPPVMKRYLLKFGYIGTDFSGIQRQKPYHRDLGIDMSSVQGMLELGFTQLQPLNGSKLYISSRTDAGVHALKSTAHIDLEFQFKHQHNPYNICKTVNTFFYDSEVDIRLHDVRQVPFTFSSRFSAIWRKYVYRVAVIKNDTFEKGSHNFYIPMTEHNRCYFLLDMPFKHIDLARQCCKLLEGNKDFRSFTCLTKDRDRWGEPKNILYVRTLNSADILPSQSLFQTEMDDTFDYYNFQFVGRAYLYRQVRKMVTALIAVAQGKISQEYFQEMLDKPSIQSWDYGVRTIPGYGLYLMDVGYREEDMMVVEDDTRYSLILESIPDNKKLEVIKTYRELHGACTVLQARTKLTILPIIIRTDLVKDEAEYYKTIFENMDCNIRMEEIDVGEESYPCEDKEEAVRNSKPS